VIAAVIPYAGESVDVLNATLQACGDLADFGVLAVDGVDLDESQIDADGWTVHIVRLPTRSGCPAAMNAGIREAAARGATRIGRCDTGDEWRAGMGSVLRCGAPAAFGSSQLPVLNYWAKRIWSDNQFQASCTAFDVAVWQAVGGYDETLRFADDWDFAVKVHARFGWDRQYEIAAVVDASGISQPGDAAKEQARNRDLSTVARRALAARKAKR
jgi:hypothetical protein